MSYADSTVWDRRFEREGDLDWGGLWTDPFVETLRERNCRFVLDLGCGTGNDVARLAHAGFHVTGLDFSAEAISMAQSKEIGGANFLQADMARPLPFPSNSFDAVFANVALHMFDAATTRSVVAEVKRVLKPNGQFMYHVNSLADRELRALRRKAVRELGENRIEEEDGQTVHFFSEDFLRSLFDTWRILKLEPVEIPHHRTGEPFKRVWRGAVTKE